MDIILVGSGTMGQEHARAYRDVDGVRVTAVVGTSERSQELAAALGAKTAASLEEAMRSVSCDVVDVCSPTSTHAQMIQIAASAGKHIFTEKPLARTVAQARETLAYCEEQGVALGVGHVLTYFPEYAHAYRVVTSGKLGSVGTARLSRKTPYPQTEPNWYIDDEQSGGVILDLMIHDFDFLVHCFGPAERIMARRTQQTGAHRLDYALVTVRHTSGVIAHVEGAWGYPGPFHTTFEICGDKGILENDNLEATSVHTALYNPIEAPGGVSLPSVPLRESPFVTQLKDFLQCISRDEPPETAKRALYSLSIAEAALTSAQTGHAVTLKGGLAQ